MASLSPEFETEIQKSIADKPLEAGEFRKIPCLDSFKISIESRMDDGLEPFFRLSVEGQQGAVYLYRRSGQ